ncbi:MAG TPA: phytase [Luteimonas sp.]|nr:phytase [Luteimonas sp.]
MRTLCGLATVMLCLGGCTQVQQGAGDPLSTLAPAARTAAAESGEVLGAALLLGEGPDGNRIVSATARGGLELHTVDGRRVAAVAAGEVAAVDVAYGIGLGDDRITLVAAIDTTTPHSLRLFRFAADTLVEVAPPVPLGFAGEGLCLSRNPLSGVLNAFVVGDGGEIEQRVIHDAGDGTLAATQVRRISVPSPLKQCAVDHAAGHVYASEETVGIWRLNADPESDVAAALIDLPRGGHIEEEVGGLAVHEGEGGRWLFASNASAGSVNVYDLADDAAYIGSFRIAAGDDATVDEPGPMFAAGPGLGPDMPDGALLVTDEDGPDVKLLSIGTIAEALGFTAGAPRDPRTTAPGPGSGVVAVAETVPVASYGDAADDPAIWANPMQPGMSLIVATDKKSGLYVHDMQGRVKHYVADGKMNNVDLRDGFDLGGEKVVLVTASDRTRKSIAIYRLDTGKGELVEIADGVQPTGMHDPYGLCMYRSQRNGDFYVFINGDDTVKRQWRLLDAGNGRVRTELVRELEFDSQTEGCVADDETGILYVGEEDVALWKLSAEPDGGDDKTVVERIADNPAVKDDFEGVGLYDLGEGRGYIIVSSQGNDTYAVYRREAEQEYLGSFAVVADPARGIDGISETDGLDVSSANLGPGLEYGAMVAQDGRNVLPAENQNYKIVSWKAIAEALGLEMRQP